MTSAEWNSQPAVLIDCRFTVTWVENGGEFPVYLHMGIQTSPSHSFVVAYMANDAADMDTLMDSGIWSPSVSRRKPIPALPALSLPMRT